MGLPNIRSGTKNPIAAIWFWSMVAPRIMALLKKAAIMNVINIHTVAALMELNGSRSPFCLRGPSINPYHGSWEACVPPTASMAVLTLGVLAVIF